MTKLSPKQQKFADLVLESVSATEAYARAGYKVTNENSAAASASRLLRNAKIEAYIAERQQNAMDKAEITLEWLLEQGKGIMKDARDDKAHGPAVSALKEVSILSGNRVEKQQTEIITHEERLAQVRDRMAQRQQPTRH